MIQIPERPLEEPIEKACGWYSCERCGDAVSWGKALRVGDFVFHLSCFEEDPVACLNKFVVVDVFDAEEMCND